MQVVAPHRGSAGDRHQDLPYALSQLFLVGRHQLGDRFQFLARVHHLVALHHDGRVDQHRDTRRNCRHRKQDEQRSQAERTFHPQAGVRNRRVIRIDFI